MGFEREKRRASTGEELALKDEHELERLKAKRARVVGRQTLVGQAEAVQDEESPFHATAMREVFDAIGAVARGQRAGWVDEGAGVGPAMWQVAERRAQTLHRRAMDHDEIDAHDPAITE